MASRAFKSVLRDKGINCSRQKVNNIRGISHLEEIEIKAQMLDELLSVEFAGLSQAKSVGELHQENISRFPFGVHQLHILPGIEGAVRYVIVSGL